ncbi:MAG: DUF1573 domain-containing protein [Bacteroidetes bacterium]|nr:DUF1573 domain-containing protein [Bacteroidota bacterium]
MKKLIISNSLMAGLLMTLGAASAQNGPGSNTQPAAQPAPQVIENPNAAVMDFESETIDYGTIKQGSDPYREFKFTNTGKEPLIITKAKGSCGCTIPEWPKEPINPGESSVIRVRYDTKRVGVFTKSVTISSNAKTPSKVIKIKGKVEKVPVEPEQSPVKPSVPGVPID